MARVLYKGAWYSVLQTETYALPAGTNELRVKVSQVELAISLRRSRSSTLEVEAGEATADQIPLKIYGFDTALDASFEVSIGDIDGKLLLLSVIGHGIGTQKNPPRVISLTLLLEEK